jgi:hypothetical protein
LEADAFTRTDVGLKMLSMRSAGGFKRDGSYRGISFPTMNLMAGFGG